MIITIINHTKLATNEEIQKVVDAINIQIERDFTPWWGIKGNLVLAENVKDTALPNVQDNAIIYLQDTIDAQGALGYHEANHSGIPFGIVDLQICKQAGEAWSTTLSHEVLELLGDPQANITAMGPHPSKNRTVFYWYEMCDAVQGDSYKINEVSVSNFVLPTYFVYEGKGQNDFMNLGVKNFGVRPKGYVGYFDPASGKVHQIFGEMLTEIQNHQASKARLGAARRAAKYQKMIDTTDYSVD